MIVTCNPSPFDPHEGFRIEVEDAPPPYTFEPAPSPPNPPGVRVLPTGEVFVDPAPPPDTAVVVVVTDASGAQEAATNHTR